MQALGLQNLRRITRGREYIYIYKAIWNKTIRKEVTVSACSDTGNRLLGHMVNLSDSGKLRFARANSKD